MTNPRPAVAALLVAALAVTSGAPTVSAHSPAPTPEATIGVPGTDGWGPAGAPVPTKGRLPDGAIGADGEIDADGVPDFVAVLGRDGVSVAGYAAFRDITPPDLVQPWWYQRSPIPVYAGDLRTVVGFMFDGKGFVPLGVDPATVPSLPDDVSPLAPASPAPSPLASVEPPVVSNETSLPVSVQVNGTILQVIPPTTQSPLAVTGPPPWYIELLAPDGFRLATGYIGGEGPLFYRTDLSCGRIDITWRTVILGPMTGPGQPGACGPGARASASALSSASPTGAQAAPSGVFVANATEAGFMLTFSMPRTTWSTDDSIEATAALVSTTEGTTRVGGSGHGLLGFAYAEVGGRRDIEPFWTLACGPYDLRTGVPFRSSLTKTGWWDPHGRDADFYRGFFAGPSVHLPVGTWDITAVASFVEGARCDGAVHEMRATIRVTVEP